MFIPFGGDGKVEVMTISVSGGNLIGNHPDMQNPLVFRPTDGARWNVTAGTPASRYPVTTPDGSGCFMAAIRWSCLGSIGSSIAVIEETQINLTDRFLAIDPCRQASAALLA